VIEVTEDVTTFPTDGSGAPDVRYLTGGVTLGGKQNSPGSASGNVTKGDVKRTLFPGEVALLLARTDPTSSQTDGSIDYISIGTEQDY
jgi:hypothetical protein